jgi:hypothetical protein
MTPSPHNAGCERCLLSPGIVRVQQSQGRPLPQSFSGDRLNGRLLPAWLIETAALFQKVDNEVDARTGFRFVNTNRLSLRILLASLSITSTLAPASGARSVLLTVRNEHRARHKVFKQGVARAPVSLHELRCRPLRSRPANAHTRDQDRAKRGRVRWTQYLHQHGCPAIAMNSWNAIPLVLHDRMAMRVLQRRTSARGGSSL